MGGARGHFIDLQTWKRRQHFELFRPFAYPFFSATVDVDVTAMWRRCRERAAPSFFLTSLFALLQAVNASEPLRMRLRDGGVWVHEQVGIGTPILRPDETFAFGRFDPAPTLAAFARTGLDTIARVKASADINAMADEDDLVYHSTLPWLKFTSFTNALSGQDSIPRVTFGQVCQVGTVYQMPVAIAVHHALADGLDVARLVEGLQARLSRAEETK